MNNTQSWTYKEANIAYTYRMLREWKYTRNQMSSNIIVIVILKKS